MKKNLLSILTLALELIIIALLAVMMFSILPASRKTDKMITQICTALNLELESQKTVDKAKKELKIDQLETHNIEDEMTIVLKKGTDSKDHFVQIAVSLVVNKKDKDYKKYVESITTKESLIKDSINSTIGGFTVGDLENDSDNEKLRSAVLKGLQELFDSEFIVNIAFSKVLIQ